MSLLVRRHAKLIPSQDYKWKLPNEKELNGLWLSSDVVWATNNRRTVENTWQVATIGVVWKMKISRGVGNRPLKIYSHVPYTTYSTYDSMWWNIFNSCNLVWYFEPLVCGVYNHSLFLIKEKPENIPQMAMNFIICKISHSSKTCQWK